jgi:secondary thiamine-phosphate synthase enzyme
MKVSVKKLNLKSQKQFEILDITPKVVEAIKESGISDGTVTVFAPHTTAAIKINHNEPLLIQDLMHMLYRLIPVDISYSHDTFEMHSGVEPGERSNGHAHVKAFLMNSSETIPIKSKELVMGPRQSIFFVEFDGGRARSVVITVMGE